MRWRIIAAQRCLLGIRDAARRFVTRALIQDLDPAKTEIALVTNPRCTPEESISEILYELGHEEELTERAQIVHRLHEVLYENFEAGKNTLSSY